MSSFPSIPELLASGQLKRHQPSPREIVELLELADRQLADGEVTEVSPDGRFASAYGAALTLATVVVAASGYRVGHVPGHHRLTIGLLPELKGEAERRRATYLDACRRKRNAADYERVGAVSLTEVDALCSAARELREDVAAWLATEHPELTQR